MNAPAKWELRCLIIGPSLSFLFGFFLGLPIAQTSGVMAGLGLGILLGIGSAAFAVAAEVPSIIAYRRMTPNRIQVYLTNFFGWWALGIGWIVGLIMAVGPVERGSHRADPA